MDKNKVSELAKACSLSCKKVVKDKRVMQTLASSSAVLVSLTVVNLVSATPVKCSW